MTEPIVPCSKNQRLQDAVEGVADAIKLNAHTLGEHGLSESEFYDGGVFRGAIERLRGQFSATMGPKRDFAANVLNHLEDFGFISSWDSAGESNRHDYTVTLNSGKTAAIELKGCLDGNNTNIFERPPNASEFIIWSVCQNPSSDPRHNVWSGIHTRLGAEIIHGGKQVDGVIVWDWICGTPARPCPKIEAGYSTTAIGQHSLPPPCIYLFPATVPSVRNNPNPESHKIEDVGILAAFHQAFGAGADEFVNTVHISVDHAGRETTRTTSVERDGDVVAESGPTTIKRS